MEEHYHHHHHQAQFPTYTATTTDVHPTPAANASPTPPHLTSNLPSYADMITAAILWDSSQGKAGGSSKRAIAKYIDRVYTNLPPTHSSLLTHHLKRLKNTGQLVMIKNSYQLPLLAASTTANTTAPAPVPDTATATSAVPVGSDPPEMLSATPTIKKRPGRPPKATTTTATATETLAPSVGVGNGPSSTGKRPRGRPPRNLNINLNQTQQQVVAEVPFVQVQAQPNYAPDLGLNNGESQSVKRRPGRPPRKQQQEAVQPVSQPQVPVVDQGANGEVIVAGNGIVQKRRAGRPPKMGNVSGGPKPKGRGRPKRNALGPVVRPIGKKPRGRPPRHLGVAPVAGGKRRGRPPKAGVSVAPVAKPVRNYTGKPRGRPKKSALSLSKPTPEQRIIDEELIKKVESIQAKIRDAVSVLKPYFTNSNATDALTALQQLDDLSTMEITTAPPPNPSVEPPVTAILLNNATIHPYNNVPSQETIDAPVSTIRAPEAAPLPPVMPFSISAPTMTDSAPFYLPPNIGTQQPTSWIPSGGAPL